mmetsp:Transcript_66502/g.156970  ORF Transcript_66502/g.156970 Transcript_66502/m.156970 type:complete len:508 (-) Transcript_66502:861-2384(-)
MPTLAMRPSACAALTRSAGWALAQGVRPEADRPARPARASRRLSVLMRGSGFGEAELVQAQSLLKAGFALHVADAECQAWRRARKVDVHETEVDTGIHLGDAAAVGRGDVPDFGQAAGGQVPQRIAGRRVPARQVGVVHIAADDDHAFGALLADQVDQALALQREVAPALPAGALGGQLHAGAEDAHIGRLGQALGQPGPLRLAEQRGGRVEVGQIPALHRAAAELGLGIHCRIALLERGVGYQRRAVEAQVQHQHLHAAAGAFDPVGLVDAGPRAARRVGRLAPFVAEQLLRQRLQRVLAADVVVAEVMVVPDREVGHVAAEGLQGLDAAELGVALAQRVGVARVGVEVVAQEQEQLRPRGPHRGPDGLRLGLLGAGAEGDAQQLRVGRCAERQRARTGVRTRLRARAHRRQPGGQHQLAPVELGGLHQSLPVKVTKTWRGAPVSRVWLSPVLPKPLLPTVEMYFLSVRLVTPSCTLPSARKPSDLARRPPLMLKSVRPPTAASFR